MAVEARPGPATRSGALARVAGQLGIDSETLRNWVMQAEVDQGARPGTTSADAERLREREREVKELRRADAILRSAWPRTESARSAVESGDLSLPYRRICTLSAPGFGAKGLPVDGDRDSLPG